MIGWSHTLQTGTNGIFGIPLAYADCCEEQARYTLHSHISVWIKDFNKVISLLFHGNDTIRSKAKSELEMYFQTISQATFGDLFDFEKNSNECSRCVLRLNNVLVPPKDQDLRLMRHHVHCHDLHGVVGYYPKTSSYCPSVCRGSPDIITSEEIVSKNTQVFLGRNLKINNFTKQQLDIMAYTFPYHMQLSDSMKPIDCRSLQVSQSSINDLSSAILDFNLRNPMLQLRFNIHDCYHRPSCFKKGPECRTELPQKHRQIATIQFDKDNTITWYFVDGTVRKIAPFKYHHKRNIGDQFMNANNDIATTVLACNNNVTSGDKVCF